MLHRLWRQCSAAGLATHTPQTAASSSKRCFGAVAVPGHGLSLTTYASFLRTCAKSKALRRARQAHHYFITQGLERTLILENLLLHVYGECGALDELQRLFVRMPYSDLLSWNFAIKAQALQGHHLDALQLFTGMQHQGIFPNKYIYISLFTALTQRSALKAGMSIHACICGIKLGADIAILTALIIMYGNCGKPELARTAFDNVPLHDAVSWTAMIVVYAQHAKGEDALSLFRDMLLKGLTPDSVSFVSVLDACAGIEALAEGKKLHFLIISSGLQVNAILGTALVNMYGKCGSLEDARRIFLDMKNRNIASWNTLIGSNAYHKQSNHAFQLFEQTLQECTLPDKVTFVCVFDTCTGSMSRAAGKRTHARIIGNVFECDIVIQTALIDFYGSCNQFFQACKVFANMADHDDVSLISIVSACANCAAFIEGKQLHSHIICNAFDSNVVLGTALINMYSKCGSILDAQNVFERIRIRNIISWNAIIGACCQNGFGKQTLSLYERMLLEKVKPDAITFLNVLSACSHAGLLKEGSRCFLAMKQDYGLVPNIDHYNCMIDLLGRTGRLFEAEELILNMPVEPSVASWTTLLSACRKEVDVMRAERVAFRLFHMDPGDTVPHVMLANTYAAAGRVDDAEGVMVRMREKGLKKLEQCVDATGSSRIFADCSSHLLQADVNAFINSINGFIHN